MPLDYLGKLLFPRQQPWKGRQQAKNLIAVLVVGLGFAGIVVAIMLLANSRN